MPHYNLPCVDPQNVFLLIPLKRLTSTNNRKILEIRVKELQDLSFKEFKLQKQTHLNFNSGYAIYDLKVFKQFLNITQAYFSTCTKFAVGEMIIVLTIHSIILICKQEYKQKAWHSSQLSLSLSLLLLLKTILNHSGERTKEQPYKKVTA